MLVTMLVLYVVFTIITLWVMGRRYAHVEEYQPTMLDTLYEYNTHYVPEWAMYGTPCTYTRFGTHAWEVDARLYT